jgi:hypothetical protein
MGKKGQRMRTAFEPRRSGFEQHQRSAPRSTVSRPFTRPTSGKIAAKVINPYGHEVARRGAVPFLPLVRPLPLGKRLGRCIPTKGVRQ